MTNKKKAEKQDSPPEKKDNNGKQVTRAYNHEAEQRIELYSRFVKFMREGDDGGLREKHRKELREKRGFTDETIERCGFLSADPELVREAIFKLKKDFIEEDLGKAGLLKLTSPSKRNPEGVWNIAKFLVDGNVLIPYFDEKGQVIYIRGHKLGPSQVGLEIYGEEVLSKARGAPSFSVVLTEGEFKAAALQQCNIPAIAIPGISSFGGKHLDYLKEVLYCFSVKEVVVLFDNEVKDNPKFERSYKPDPLKRWDTDYWAIRMAKQLYRSHGVIKSTLIARLPDEWRDKAGGKIDPDGALALGYTADDLRRVVEEAMTPDRYLETLPSKEARKVISWKLKKDGWRGVNPQEVKGCYLWGSPKEGQKPEELILSNFILKPTYTLIRAGADKTRERQYKGITTQGEEFLTRFSPRQLANNQQFTEALLQQGDLNWTGRNLHLNALRQRLMDTAPPFVAEESDFFGHDQERGFFVFGDGVLFASGQSVSIGEDGVIWSGLKGLVPLQDEKSPVPKMGLDKFDPTQAKPASPVEIYEALKAAYGFAGAGLALGWSLACVFSDQIFDHYGFFPLLALQGPKESGKSTVADLIVGQWGFTRKGTSAHRLDWRQSTPKGLQRTFAKYRSLPVFIDEYRNDAPSALVATLRALFDRSAGVQAEFSNDGRTKTTSIRGCGVFAGEEVPDDPALQSRCVVLEIDRNRRSKKAFESCRKTMNEGLSLIRWTILNSKKLSEDLIEFIENFNETLTEVVGANSTGARIAASYAIPLAVFAIVAEKVDGEEKAQVAVSDLLSWIRNELPQKLEERTEDDHLGRFFQALAQLAQTPEPGGVRRTEGDLSVPVSMRIDPRHVILGCERRALYLHLSSAHAVYEEAEKRAGRAPFTLGTIRGYLKHAPFAESGFPRKFWPLRTSKKAWCIALEDSTCPESAFALEEAIKGMNEEHSSPSSPSSGSGYHLNN